MAPKVADRFAMEVGTRSSSTWVSTLSGMVAAELRDVNAKVSTGQTFLKYPGTLTPPSASRPACTPNMIAIAA